MRRVPLYSHNLSMINAMPAKPNPNSRAGLLLRPTLLLRFEEEIVSHMTGIELKHYEACRAGWPMTHATSHFDRPRPR